MNNRFCITKEKLVKIFWRGWAGELANDTCKHFPHFCLSEIIKQIKSNEGEVAEFHNAKIKKFSVVTENNEIALAIDLADLYFPNKNADICFEMKSGFTNKEVNSYKELIKNMENNTDIDCLIKADDKEFKFQLKEYPEKYIEWGADKVMNFLDKKILPESKYNNKGSGNLIVVILIKPERHSNFKEEEDLKKVSRYLAGKNIYLSEINFIYNRNNECVVLFQVFPQYGYRIIPFDKLSYHQAKLPEK